jgi:hypothetical protein
MMLQDSNPHPDCYQGRMKDTMKKRIVEVFVCILLIGACFVVNIKSVSVDTTDSQLVAYWKFDEGSGNIVADSSGNVNITNLENNPTWIDGKSGKALNFDGAGNCIFKAMNTSIMTQTPLTLSAWIQPNLRTDGTDFPTNVISNDFPGDSGFGFGVNVWSSGSQMNLEIPGPGWWRIVPGVNFSAGIWYYVSVVYTNVNVKSYINGQLVDDFSYEKVMNLSEHNYVWIGIHNQDATTYNTRRFFSGTIDEVRIYNKALSQQEIQIDMDIPPIASFTWTPVNPMVNQQITFDASVSNDSDGSITKYEWDWNNDGTYDDSKTTPIATYSWAQAGSYPVKLQVTDNIGVISTKALSVTVSSGGGNGGTDNKGTPGFELIIAISAIALIFFWKRKSKK